MAEATQAPVVEEVKNCPACKKPLKKARRFYRNGAYYCNNNCFKKVQAQVKAEAAEAAQDAQAAQAAEAAKVAEKSEEKPQA
jgi:hypothetical protein